MIIQKSAMVRHSEVSALICRLFRERGFAKAEIAAVPGIVGSIGVILKGATAVVYPH